MKRLKWLLLGLIAALAIGIIVIQFANFIASSLAGIFVFLVFAAIAGFNSGFGADHIDEDEEDDDEDDDD